MSALLKSAFRGPQSREAIGRKPPPGCEAAVRRRPTAIYHVRPPRLWRCSAPSQPLLGKHRGYIITCLLMDSFYGPSHKMVFFLHLLFLALVLSLKDGKTTEDFFLVRRFSILLLRRTFLLGAGFVVASRSIAALLISFRYPAGGLCVGREREGCVCVCVCV